MTDRERLAEAVKRTAEAIAYGAKLRGIELPEDFAEERARNIVSALVDLFEDAEDAGFSKAYKDGVERWPDEPKKPDGEPS